jgi:hypothetical protein
MAFIPTTPGGTGTTLTSAVITQAAHGFTVGNALYWNGTAYVKANASNATSSEVIGIVSSVPSANTFTVATAGLITGLTGLTSGEVYWLSDVTAGLATTTQPTAVSSVSKPLFVATSATTAQLQIFDTAPASGQTAVVQYGENLGITNGGTFTTTLIDIAGSSFTLNPGTYNVDFIVTGSNATQNVGTVALYTSADVLVAGSQAQNSWVASDKVQLIGNATVIVSTTTTYKLKGQTNAGVFTVSNVPASFSSTAGVSKISWTQIGASPVPMDLVGEYGINTSITNGSTVSTTTFIDVPGGSITLPTAGTWFLQYSVATINAVVGGTSQVKIVDSLNADVVGSYSAEQNGVAGERHANFGQAVVTTSGAAIYKLQFASGGANTVTIFNNTTNNGQSTFSYRKISGFLPSSGQTVDYVEVALTADATVNTATAIPFQTVVSGNIPYNSGTGRFTLSAGKTYRLEAQLVLGAGGGSAEFSWYNVTAGTNVGMIGDSQNANLANTSSPAPLAVYTFTPSVATEVELRNVQGTSETFEGGALGTAKGSFARITQLGSSAVISGVYPGTWTSYTPVITGTTTNPTIPTSGTITGSYSVNGKMLNLNIKYFASSVSGGAAGSGSYIFSLPAGYIIDTTKANIPTAFSQTAGDGLDGGVVGSATARNSGATAFGWATPLTTTGIGIFDQSTAKLIGSATISLNGNSNTTYAISAQIPLV